MRNFWNESNKPILSLAPMADVTDAAFRYIIAKYSKQITPQKLDQQGSPLLYSFVMWTEFVSADGLVRATPEGKKKLMKGLEFDEIERPIVAQLFTSKPEMMEQAAKIVLDLGFDGLDINMGCPDRNIEKQDAGAALMKNPALAREIIRAAKRGVENKIPVSVKTRLGYNKDELETWLPELLAENPAVVTIHARTRKEMSKVPARWERVKRAVEIRNKFGGEVLIFGNGDAGNPEEALQKCKETGADGAMLGRAIFGTPWLFANEVPSNEKIIEILTEHIKIFDGKLGGVKNFAVMKKHFKAYLSGEALAKSDQLQFKELREKMLNTESAEEALGVLNSQYN